MKAYKLKDDSVKKTMTEFTKEDLEKITLLRQKIKEFLEKEENSKKSAQVLSEWLKTK